MSLALIIALCLVVGVPILVRYLLRKTENADGKVEQNKRRNERRW